MYIHVVNTGIAYPMSKRFRRVQIIFFTKIKNIFNHCLVALTDSIDEKTRIENIEALSLKTRDFFSFNQLLSLFPIIAQQMRTFPYIECRVMTIHFPADVSLIKLLLILRRFLSPLRSFQFVFFSQFGKILFFLLCFMA